MASVVVSRSTSIRKRFIVTDRDGYILGRFDVQPTLVRASDLNYRNRFSPLLDRALKAMFSTAPGHCLFENEGGVFGWVRVFVPTDEEIAYLSLVEEWVELDV